MKSSGEFIRNPRITLSDEFRPFVTQPQGLEALPPANARCMPRNQTKPFAGPEIRNCRSMPILAAEFYMLGA